MKRHYRLVCPVCGKEWEDDTYLLSCPDGCTGLLRTVYDSRCLTVRDKPGLFRYYDWLPVTGTLPTRAAPLCYKSSGLAKALGLNNLWIVFSGYWPERGCEVISGSFKEFEAIPTVVRLNDCTGGIIVVSSAGNTGRAFAEVSAQTGQPVIVVVPETSRSRIYTTVPADDLLLVTIRGDYTDAIQLGSDICCIPGLFPEGGAKNVARRDGMGLCMIEGTRVIGRMPDWYIQGVGSGTGGIAAWEASMRLSGDGRFGTHLPRLYLVQNDPFIPMVSAWSHHRRVIHPEEDNPEPEKSIKAVFADVLTNRSPPYSVPGGVYDALTATNGLMGSATTTQAKTASDLFERTEGIDPDPAAAVAVAGLINAVQKNDIDPDACILLCVTGGGYRRMTDRIIKKTDIEVENEYDREQILNTVRTWVNRYA